MIRSLAELRELAEDRPPTRVAVASAEGESTLSAVLLAAKGGWVDPLLFGDRRTIEARLSRAGMHVPALEIIDEPDAHEATRLAVSAVRYGDASVLLKGSVSTPALMRQVLDRETGLRAGALLSDVFVFDYSAGDPPRIVGITDGGVTPFPDEDAMASIARNAIRAFGSLGNEMPRVAFLSATETITSTFPGSVQAAALAERGRSGELGRCIAEGPLALDLALSAGAAAAKGIESQIEGRADILVFPNLEAANITAKAVQYAIPVEPGHIIVGGTAPVLIPSRSESPLARLNSLALGCILGRADAPPETTSG